MTFALSQAAIIQSNEVTSCDGVTSPPPTLTLVGLAVSGDQVLELEAVGSHLLLGLAANGRHVAVLHLAGAAARPGLEAHAQGIICKTERKTFPPTESVHLGQSEPVKSLQSDFWVKHFQKSQHKKVHLL